MGHFYLGYYTYTFCRDVNNTKLIGRRKSLSFRFHEIATQARNDRLFELRPKLNLFGAHISLLCRVLLLLSCGCFLVFGLSEHDKFLPNKFERKVDRHHACLGDYACAVHADML